MILIRSVVFNALFYLTLFVHLIAALPTFFMPRKALFAVCHSWAATNHFLLRVICGTRYEIRGAEKIPKGALIVASKHQSVWETFALIPLLSDPTYILKRELMWIPWFGWYIWKADMVPIDRGARGKVLESMIANSRRACEQGRQIIIFPEGTRRPPGAEPTYKYGVALVYDATGVPCVPVALNSGVFWPRRKLLRYPGTIVLEVLDPIPPGLDKDTFFQRLQHDIETATARLIEEGKRELSS